MSHIYIVIGPSGIGKTTIGSMLGERLGLPFYDADDYHKANSISKMSKGVPLNDQDRLPWLEMLADKIKAWYAGEGAVLACSALKESYREKLMSIPRKNITWIYLYGDTALIRSRLAARKEHFFNKELLRAQYSDLEVPEYGCHVNVSNAPEEVLAEILFCIKDKNKYDY